MSHALISLLFSIFIFARASQVDNEVLTEDSVKLNEDEDEGGKNATLGELFQSAAEAYLEEDWDGCIDGFLLATQKYKDYVKMVTDCRRTCRAEAQDTMPIFVENIEDLHFYEKKVRETLCLMKCNEDIEKTFGMTSVKHLLPDDEKKYMEHYAYEYLHICYYQKKRIQDAANAIFTFLIVHPDHEISRRNLRWYLDMPGAEEENLQNMEPPPFLKMYAAGITAYDDEDYQETVLQLENSLQAYIEAEEVCRAYCEGPFNQGWFPEFTLSISNHFTLCLKCKRMCSKRLNNLNGEHHKDLLASHYHYLQFAYYKLGRLKEACAAVESYLLFYPVDETVLENREYFLKQPDVEEEYFEERPEALSYVKRQEYELRLLLYIQEEFRTLDTKANEKKEKKNQMKKEDDDKGKQGSVNFSLNTPPGHSSSSQNRFASNNSELQEQKKRKKRAVHQLKNAASVKVVAGEKELGGKRRYVADGFLNATECDLLMQLAKIGAVEGDGYEGVKNPHSKHETFEGLTLGRAALMVYFGLMEPELLEMFLRVTDSGQDHVERYFHIDRPLYSTYTHLACRSTLPGAPLERADLSHPVHADNCLLGKNGECLRERPAFTYRDYSAILYLNDDFEGGEFIFAEDGKAKIVQSMVEPRCGRMVAFSSGVENLHGVRGILRGRRCALALWFTHEEKHLEVERILASAVLKRVKDEGFTGNSGKGDSVDIPLHYEEMLMSRFKEDESLMDLLEA